MRDSADPNNVVALMAFASVVSTGSFSAAAKRLNCSKAAVSRQVAQLEARIGFRLLNRTTRHVAVTPAGQEIYARCSRIVDEVTETNQIMAGMLSTPRGELQVSAPVVSTLFRITEIIPQFVKQYPEVRVNLSLTDSKVDLLNGGFDVAFWLGEPHDAALDAVKLRTFRMVICASPAYLQCQGEPATPAELKEHSCIIETHLSRPGEWRISADQTIRVNPGSLTSNSVRMSREAALSDVGLAYLPHFIVAEDLARKRLVAVLSAQVSAELPFYLIFPKSHYLLAKTRTFIDFMAKAVAEEATAKPDAPSHGGARKGSSNPSKKRGRHSNV